MRAMAASSKLENVISEGGSETGPSSGIMIVDWKDSKPSQWVASMSMTENILVISLLKGFIAPLNPFSRRKILRPLRR